ncbi:MAG TPA: hypothetical protein VN445_09035 [Rectinemataceae bacterium]|nr:hypothetical protein [Rectinemataceae bacterium]
MNTKIATRRTYIPKWGDNRKQSDQDQIIAHYKILSCDEKTRIMPDRPLEFQYNPDGSVKGGSVSISTFRRPLVKNMLLKLENCSYEDEDGVKHEIKSASDLLGAPTIYEDLINELGDFFKDELEKGIEEKN